MAGPTLGYARLGILGTQVDIPVGRNIQQQAVGRNNGHVDRNIQQQANEGIK